MTISRSVLSQQNVNFNSHPHEEDDRMVFKLLCTLLCISTHILTRRMTVHSVVQLILVLFQLTSSRGGWRILCRCTCNCWTISTHILTRRMTMSRVYVSIFTHISTHILTRRMTVEYLFIIIKRYAISTHILTRRMTLAALSYTS